MPNEPKDRVERTRYRATGGAEGDSARAPQPVDSPGLPVSDIRSGALTAQGASKTGHRASTPDAASPGLPTTAQVEKLPPTARALCAWLALTATRLRERADERHLQTVAEYAHHPDSVDSVGALAHDLVEYVALESQAGILERAAVMLASRALHTYASPIHLVLYATAAATRREGQAVGYRSELRELARSERYPTLAIEIHSVTFLAMGTAVEAAAWRLVADAAQAVIDDGPDAPLDHLDGWRGGVA